MVLKFDSNLGNSKSIKNRANYKGLLFVRPVGVEPTTHSLKGSCSTS